MPANKDLLAHAGWLIPSASPFSGLYVTDRNTPTANNSRLGRWMRTVLLGIAAASPVACSLASAAERKPNVVFILADDLGWSDTTLFGTTKFYQTPNIERLAARGMTFTHAYSSQPALFADPVRAS